ncbi:MAG: hypothetical protein R3C44_01965 [Chloroflexota bacterium]
MATFVEQVREMGVKQAVVTKADEVVERVTAGMNVNDIRSALRGDEPRRPNPVSDLMLTASGFIYGRAFITRPSPTSTPPSDWGGCPPSCWSGKPLQVLS